MLQPQRDWTTFMLTELKTLRLTEPFRIAHGKVISNNPDVGELRVRPGFFSQQMALPWQADFYDCHKEQWDDPDGKQYYFMWWTAQRPDDVFPPVGDKQVRWVRNFDDPAKTEDENEDDLNRFKQMQSRWFELKFISNKNINHYEEEP